MYFKIYLIKLSFKTDGDLPDASLSDAANYCRNPEDKEDVYCYTTDSQVDWNYCYVPYCGKTLVQVQDSAKYNTQTLQCKAQPSNIQTL